MEQINPQLLHLITQMDATHARLFACDCAEQMIPFFEKYYPDDQRPYNAIHIARAYVQHQATQQELDHASSEVESCAWEVSDYEAIEPNNNELCACASIAIVAEATCCADPYDSAFRTLKMIDEVVTIQAVGMEYADLIWSHQTEKIDLSIMAAYEHAINERFAYHMKLAKTYLQVSQSF